MKTVIGLTAATVAVVAVIAGVVALNGLIVMVVLGALGHIFDVNRLFLSFGDSVVVGVALSVLGSFLGRVSVKR